MPAAMVSTTWRSSSATSSRATVRTLCGLTAITTTSASATEGASIAAKVATPKRAATLARASGSISTTLSVPGSCPRAMRPPRSARAMLPPPMMLTFIARPLRLPGAEERGTDAHHRRALRDGGFEIRRHAHRQRVQSEALRARRLEERAQPPELAAYALDVPGLLGDAHESAQDEPRQLRNRTRERRRVAGRRPALGALPADVDLHADVERRKTRIARVREALGDLEPVHGLDPGEALGGEPRLVGLEGSDHVPLDSRRLVELRDFANGLLHVVLAECPVAQGVGGPDLGRRLALAHGEQPDGRRIASRAVSRLGDPRCHGLPRLLLWAHNQMTSA